MPRLKNLLNICVSKVTSTSVSLRNVSSTSYSICRREFLRCPRFHYTDVYVVDSLRRVCHLSSRYYFHHMMQSNVLTAILCCFVLSCFTAHADGSATNTLCPKKCTCSKNFMRVSCEHRELYDIPSGIPTTATELYLGYNKLTVIESGSFSTLNNLTQLSLLNNHITELHNLSFSGLQKLKYLTLRKNRLSTISRDAFKDLGNLQNLYLTDNFLTAIPDLSFVPSLIYLTLDTNNLESANLCSGSTNLTKLSTIIVSTNVNLTQITKEDFKCVKRSSVRSVDLSRCSLTKFEEDFFVFPHLQSLKLSYNNISYEMLQRIFSAVVPSDLTSLDLSGVLQPADILPPELFRNLSAVKLKHLSLSHTRGVNHITNPTFQHLPFLQFLDLSNSEFISITDTSFSMMRNLSRISLHHNKMLYAVPKFNISSLQRLDLNDNDHIDELPNDIFSGLSNLSNLLLQNCQIRTIRRHTFSGLEKLQKLDLSCNAIANSAIPSKALSAMQNLVSLDLSSNKYAAVATQYDLFSGLAKLQWLDFSQNDCGNVSTRIFQPLVNLQTLNLAGNRLGQVIEADGEGQLFRGLSKLRSLRLDSNELRVLQYTTFGSLSGLRILNLSHNYLAAWAAGMFNASGELDIVDFSSNKIAIVTEMELLTVPTNTSLNLTDNPFACYCDLIWFRRWIQAHNSSKKLSHLQSYICTSPDQMAKKPLLDFNPDEIEARCHLLPVMWIVIGACGAVVAIMLFFGVVIYRYRWQLRLRLFYAQRRFRRRRPAGYIEVDEGYDYDIYVSYGPSDADREWVRTELMPRFTRINRNKNADGQLGEDNDGQRVDERLQPVPGGLAGGIDGQAASGGLQRHDAGLVAPGGLQRDGAGLVAPYGLQGDGAGLVAPGGLQGDNDGLAAPDGLQRDGTGLVAPYGLAAPDGLQRDNDGLQGDNDGLQRDNDGLQRDNDGLQRDDDGLAALQPILGECRIFVEEEDAPFNLPEFETLAKSIYNSKKVLLVISGEYLGDGRRRFEIEWAVRSRYEKRLHLDDSIIVVCMEADADVKVPPVLLPICRNQELEWTQQDKAGQELFWQKLAEVIRYKRDDDDLLDD